MCKLTAAAFFLGLICVFWVGCASGVRRARIGKSQARLFFFLVIFLMLGGCASPLNQGAYTPIIDLPPIQPVSEGHEPEVIKYDNIPTLDQWVKKYVGEGWVVIGGAAWTCLDDLLVREGERGFRNKAKEVGADLVLWAEQPAGRTETTYVPVGVPNASTATATPYGVIQNPSAPTVYNVPIGFGRIEQKGIFLVRPSRQEVANVSE